MDLDTLKLVISVGQFLTTGGIGIWLYIDKKNDKTNVRITHLETKLDERMDNHASRLASLEATVERVPSHNDLSRVAESVAETKALLGAMKHQLDQISSYLLNKK